MQALLFVREWDHDKTNIYNDTGENFTEKSPCGSTKGNPFPFKVGNNDSESHLAQGRSFGGAFHQGEVQPIKD